MRQQPDNARVELRLLPRDTQKEGQFGGLTQRLKGWEGTRRIGIEKKILIVRDGRLGDSQGHLRISERVGQMRHQP